MRGLTLTRTVGTFQVSTSINGTAPDFAVGIFVRHAGTNVDPSTGVDLPWIWWAAGACKSNEQDLLLFDIDMKGQRKFEDPDDNVTIRVENADPADTLLYAFGIRTLYRLP